MFAVKKQIGLSPGGCSPHFLDDCPSLPADSICQPDESLEMPVGKSTKSRSGTGRRKSRENALADVEEEEEADDIEAEDDEEAGADGNSDYSGEKEGKPGRRRISDADAKNQTELAETSSLDESEPRNDENNMSTKRRGPRTTIKAKQLDLLKSTSSRKTESLLTVNNVFVIRFRRSALAIDIRITFWNWCLFLQMHLPRLRNRRAIFANNWRKKLDWAWESYRYTFVYCECNDKCYSAFFG